MIRKYHNHKLQTNPWLHEEAPHNNHEIPGRQTKQNNQLSLPYQDDCKTRMDTINAQQNIENFDLKLLMSHRKPIISFFHFSYILLGSGCIEFDEFLKLMNEKMANSDPEQDMRDAFKVGSCNVYSQ